MTPNDSSTSIQTGKWEKVTSHGGRRNAPNSPFWFWAGVAGVILFFGCIAWLVDFSWLHDHARSLNGAVVFVLLAVLPVMGVPASILYVVAGARFGEGWGLLVALGAIVIHLLSSWWIVHSWLKQPLTRLFTRMGKRIPSVPEGESAPICLLVALMPGVSYALKNFSLVLANVPFRHFFWICLPIHLFTAALGIMFGGFSGSMSKPQIAILVTYAVVMVSLSRYVYRRIRRRQKLNAEDKERED